jgi:hypothetical protein
MVAPLPDIFNFRPDGVVLRRFMRSDGFVRGIRGPWGSGKSAGCCVEIFRRAVQQKPGPDGVRRSRWAVVRNTGPQLKMTTIKTWLDWFKAHIFGPFKWSPPLKHEIVIALRDGTRLEMEVFFIAMDDPNDVATLYSLELTGAWINEARFVSKDVLDALTGRVNRYPAMKDGGCTWAGVILDTNAPAEEHWWPIMAGDKPMPEHFSEADRLTLVKPPDWEFYSQPPAMLEVFNDKHELEGYVVNADAENLKNLAEGYYPKLIQGKTRAWVEVNVLNRYGAAFDGRAIYNSFRAETHVAAKPFEPLPGVPVHVGLDFGRTPAATFGQRRALTWYVPFELVTTDTSVKTFARVLRAFMAERFPAGSTFHIHGDPSGDIRSQTDDTTPFDILRAEGIVALPAPTNDFLIRVEAVDSVLSRMDDGHASFVLSPRCVVLKAAMEGGYHYRRLQVSGQESYAQEPSKNRYSHVAEALQYMLLGAGEGRTLLLAAAASRPKPTNGWTPFSVFNRERRLNRRYR